MLKPELTWFLLGEKINDGWMMYRDLDDNTGVLSSFMYAILENVAGRSSTLLFWMSLILVFVQAVTFNTILISLNVVRDKTLIPALMYVICSSIFIDFYTLSPPLMATTFLLFALRYLFLQMNKERTDSAMFLMGFFVGVSVLFYPSSFVLILFFLFCALLYTSFFVRRVLLTIWGFLFPLVLVAFYYLINGALWIYLKDILFYSFTELNYWYLSPKALMLLVTLPTAIFVLAILKLSGRTGYVNFQVNARAVMILYVIACCFVFFISPKKSAYHLYVFVPALSYILAEYFMNFNRNWSRNLMFYGFTISLVVLGYSFDDSNFAKNDWITTSEIMAKPLDVDVEGKVLVLGDDVNYYYNNELATGYLNWQVAKQRFDNLRYIPQLLDVKKNFERELPDFIVDKVKVMPEVFDLLPDLNDKYQRIDEGIYLLK